MFFSRSLRLAYEALPETSSLGSKRYYPKSHWSCITPELGCPICGQKFRDSGVLNLHLGMEHSRSISQMLRQNPVQFYKTIFGEDTIKSITQKEMRYGNGLIVTLSGEDQGLWYSFVHNVGGGPLGALKYFHKLSVQEAALKGLELLNGTLQDLPVQHVQSKMRESTSKPPTTDDRTRQDVAQNIWNVSQDLNESLAETYLVRHRKIPRKYIDRLDFRFLQQGSVYKDYKDGVYVDVENKYPALLVRVEDPDGQLTGVQRVFLSPSNAKKPSWMKTNKFSRGILQNCAAIVQRGEIGNDVFVAEGPETAATLVATHLHQNNKCPVLASLSLSNIVNLSEVLLRLKPKRVIFASDNDGEDSEVAKFCLEASEKLKLNLKKHSIPLLLVRPPGSAKADWNDLLMQIGIRETRKLFKSQLQQEENKLMANNLN